MHDFQLWCRYQTDTGLLLFGCSCSSSAVHRCLAAWLQLALACVFAAAAASCALALQRIWLWHFSLRSSKGHFSVVIRIWVLLLDWRSGCLLCWGLEQSRDLNCHLLVHVEVQTNIYVEDVES